MQIMELLDAQYELAAQRAKEKLERLNKIATQVINETFTNLKNDHDKKMLQLMVEAQM